MRQLTSRDLLSGFWRAKTLGSPWCYLSKIRDALGATDKQMEILVSNIKRGNEPRIVGDKSTTFNYHIVFEQDSTYRKSYAGSNLTSIYPIKK